MPSLHFNEQVFTVSNGSKTIPLLPKEYELLSFLYRNHHHVFTREELLNAVWPMSDSYDRTVDDHVYRLRKKLQDWQEIQIETIRGRGYRLITFERENEPNPVTSDENYQKGFDLLFRSFIHYGQGKGLHSLLQHADQVDVQISPTKRLYLQFISGQFHEMVESNECSFWEKALYLLYLYSIVQFDAKKALGFMQQAIAQKKLSSREQNELEHFNILRLLIDAGQYSRARQLIAERKNENLPFLCNAELYLTLSALEDASNECLEGERYLNQFPYLREQGRYDLLRGVWEWRKGEEKQANLYFEKGLHVLQSTEMVPSLIQGVHDVLMLVPGEVSRFTRLWEELEEKYQFNDLTRKLEQLLVRSL